jgi:U3 small nucleolar ribonucleoprotein protein LCP5
MSPDQTADISEADLSQVRSLLSDVRLGAQSVRDAAKGWKDRLESTAELSYPSGISLLSLKNHLLLSYLHHLVALFALKLSSTSLTSTEGTQVVGALVKLRVVLEKVSPLEQKLKYQVEKLVRKADQAAEGADEQDVLNGELSLDPDTILLAQRVC